ncbi:hypothetical protein K7G42_07055 [Streptococcus parauberis]|uniref:Uncharacterized protein n=1 Tax=Streptococcus parauberis KRS-02083 TaxID=1207545 RepID=A0ABP2SZ51_9STRE|nr:hypothetical protein [Streptococcus parauberis]EMG25739.1 hypothetical protein SPJ1_1150 [Streptococcus parauberis KRS-02083]QBX27462.1 hypothetical protein Javan392_0006 [Streptococcus phage Javan392]WEM64344.1 hypothetical protein P1T45_06775 [Streptococcus parauberis]WOF46171.1 hypothetical protein K7G42_07055 [Streptococcus parauberis]
MNELLNEPQRLVDYYTELALKESNTYQEAIDVVRNNSEISVLGNELKNAIQNKIKKIAMNSKFN